MIKSVLFDFDGVLTTGRSGSETVCKSLAKLAGVAYESLFNEYCKYRDDLLSGITAYETVLPPLGEALGREIGPGLLREAFLETPVDEDIADLAAGLKRRGLKIGMITDNTRERIDAVAELRGWRGLFDIITVSADVGGRKNEPAIFTRTLEKLGLSADECVFIDDNENNLRVAAEMGFATLLFDCAERDAAALEMNLERILGFWR